MIELTEITSPRNVAEAQEVLEAFYSNPEVATQAGTGEGLPAIGPGKQTITHDESLAWVADHAPRPLRPDPQAVAMLRQVRKLIDRFNPVVACVVLQIIAAGFECWPPEMIVAASDDQLKEMLEAAVEFLIVRLHQRPDDEPPVPPPADWKPRPSLVDRRRELREARVDEARGPPPESLIDHLDHHHVDHLDHACSPPRAIISSSFWTSIGIALRRVLARLGGVA